MGNLERIQYPTDGSDPLSDPLDGLLSDIAIRVQLPPGLHAKADGRYAAIRDHIARPGSPLADLVAQYYPQGSMAIDATISTRGTDEEYDLDMVVELLLSLGARPDEVLHLLWLSLRDYPVSRVERQTRCVTLSYADGMHVDVTPSRRVAHTVDFESVIFHAKKGEAPQLHGEVPMNAFGFAAWFNARAPREDRFSRAYNMRLAEDLQLLAKADPIVHPVPTQVPLPLKSVTTVALQLIKRFRNIWSADRDGRYPPSVMLSCHAGHVAKPGLRLSEMVVRQARYTAQQIAAAEAERRSLDVRNPVMREDRFTDRWPEDRGQQVAFGRALTRLADTLDAIIHRRVNVEMESLCDHLRDVFGSGVVSRSAQDFFDRSGRAMKGNVQGYRRDGGLLIPSAPAIIGAERVRSVVTPRPHTNMGDWRP